MPKLFFVASLLFLSACTTQSFLGNISSRDRVQHEAARAQCTEYSRIIDVALLRQKESGLDAKLTRDDFVRVYGDRMGPLYHQNKNHLKPQLGKSAREVAEWAKGKVEGCGKS